MRTVSTINFIPVHRYRGLHYNHPELSSITVNPGHEIFAPGIKNVLFHYLVDLIIKILNIKLINITYCFGVPKVAMIKTKGMLL